MRLDIDSVSWELPARSGKKVFMRLTTVLRTTALLALGSAATLSAFGQDPNSPPQGTDPLAEAARKARAEQQAAPKPKKVFTNDDMPTPPPPKASDTKAEAAPADATAADNKDTAAENDPKNEAYWHKKFAKARANLARSEKELEVLQRDLNKNEVQYYPDPQKALMQQYTRQDINSDRAKLEAKRQEVEANKKAISDLEDDLRKAGGDPGWAR
jgi:hypothetical protein